MTDIVNIPEGILSSDFPTNADRTAGVFNQKSYDWAESARAMSARDREIAVAARTNALAAKEQAQAAAGSATVADGHANRAISEADAAMGYRNTAGAHAATASEQAGIATTKATQAVASAVQADQHKSAAADSAQVSSSHADRSAAEADRAQAAADSIAGGPITSLQVHSGLKTGAVTLGLEDLADKATDQQMQQGTELAPLLMSPAGVKAAVLAHAPKTLVREARAANAQLVKADSGKLIEITSGTFTQTFAAASALGDGWFCYLKNSGAGDITLDPNAAELIDGLTSYIMYPGEVRLVQCDGVALRSVVLKPFSKEIVTSSSFIKPPGYTGFEGLIVGGGGSGAAGVGGGTRPCIGGYNAQSVYFSLHAKIFAATEPIVVGAGGAPVTATGGAVGTNGNTGGSTLFLGIVAAGGDGGIFTASGASNISVSALTALKTFPYGTDGGELNAAGSGGTVMNSANTSLVPACGGGTDGNGNARLGGVSKLCGSAGNGAGKFTNGVSTTLSGNTATGIGCGGGAAVIYALNMYGTPCTATSGGGGAGGVIIRGVI